MERLKKIPPGAWAALAAAAAALPLLALPLVFDDVASVRDNPLLRDLSSARALFGASYTAVFRNEGFEPLTFLAIMLWGKLAGWQPWALHLLSVLGHAACAWAAARVAARLAGPGLPALLAGLLFALHPAQSESLAAVLFSGTIFSTLLFLLALDRFLAGDGRDGPAGKALTALLFGLALLFKERAFPGLLLFAALPFLKAGGGAREFRRRLPELLLLAAAVGAALLARLAAARGSGLGAEFLDPAFLPARLAAYAKMLLLPFWLSPAYQKTSPLPDAAALLALAGLAALLALALRRDEPGPAGYRPAAAGALLAVFALLPYLNLLPVNDLAEYLNSVFVSGRYLYLPLAGLALAAGAALGRSGLKPAALAAGGAALGALCLWLGASQLLLWRDEAAVWARAARLNPASPWAQYMLGSLELQRGRPDAALAPLRRALELGPSRGVRSHALGALAAALLMRGDAAAAEARAAEALKAWDGNLDAWNTFGAALAAGGKPEKAAKAFEVASSAPATGAAPLLNLGRLRLRLGQPAAAVEAFERATFFSVTPGSLEELCGAYRAAGMKEKEGLCLGDLARLKAGGD